MAIIGFWSGSDKPTGQTLSAAALATYMAVEHNYRILLVDATFNDDTLGRCFWKMSDKMSTAQKLNKGKMDISSGAEGLVSAVASNKATPEIITNFTRVVFKNRLDVLTGLKTVIPEEFTKSLMLYKDLLKTADKYYDLVMVDLEKTLKKETTKVLLENSHVIVYTFSQNLKQANTYISDMANHRDILVADKVIPLLCNSDEDSKYNVKNYARYIHERDLDQILHNTQFMEAACEAGITNIFLKTKLSNNTNDKNSQFVKSIGEMAKSIDYRLEELKYKV